MPWFVQSTLGWSGIEQARVKVSQWVSYVYIEYCISTSLLNQQHAYMDPVGLFPAGLGL